MLPLLVAVATAAGGAVGLGVRAWLRSGRWRLPYETAASRTSFGWVVLVIAALWGTAAWGLARVDLEAAWPAYAVLTAAGAALAAVDLQVHRLPDALTLGGSAVVGGLLVLASAVESDWHRMSTALWAAGLAFVVFLVLVLGGLGLGDLKLAVLLGLGLGWLSLPTALLGIGAGFVLGGLWASVLVARGASRTTRFAYGPSMLLGALVAFLAV
ncbi:prepilin peptidase [Luteipulveratus flavus]|uniref:Prepilin peptidase n=1 Tax=Luteipulveratus flavus TaxID=3031728 RepID=A0ABT6CD78_9MICO|nr:prepilin peptidase [Luteipulveratus sp. YIM 133296]MDF8266357.1 prepilin peptidase [Luteipulveratus sp. YIM 133296]